MIFVERMSEKTYIWSCDVVNILRVGKTRAIKIVGKFAVSQERRDGSRNVYQWNKWLNYWTPAIIKLSIYCDQLTKYFKGTKEGILHFYDLL